MWKLDREVARLSHQEGGVATMVVPPPPKPQNIA